MDTRVLSQSIYDIVAQEVDAIYPQFMKRVNDIDIDYFENIERSSEIIPKELNIGLRDNVLDDVNQYAMQLLQESNVKNRIAAILEDANASTAKKAFDGAKELIRGYVYTRCILNGSSDITEEELQKKYHDAKVRDLWELIVQNNKKDIIEFHHALMENTYEQCKDVLYENIISFLSNLQNGTT